MSRLDSLYIRMLHVGLIVLRQAVDSGCSEWIRIEIELLHNIPSLLGEKSPYRHLYFWKEERIRYSEWVADYGSPEVQSRMRTYYEPIWEEMEPLIIRYCAD